MGNHAQDSTGRKFEIISGNTIGVRSGSIPTGPTKLAAG